MKSKTILIIDDDMNTRETWKVNLQKLLEENEQDFTVRVALNEEFESDLIELENRQKRARNGGDYSFSNGEEGNLLIDDVAVLIVDYDLLDFENAGIATGERVAYLARCYSQCGLIVALNQFGENRFDLTLKGDFKSFADLNIGSSQLLNKNLWTDGLPNGYRPWAWFSIPRSFERFESNVEKLMGKQTDGKINLDQPILKYLQFPDEVVTNLPRKTEEFLSSRIDIKETTFRHFVEEGFNGLKHKDKVLNEESTARIAAARVSKWLERVVLPGQDILVDAPHLVSRFPSLLKEDLEKLDSWNQTANVGEIGEIGVKVDLIEDFLFKSEWLSRPAWYWQKISNFEGIDEVADPFKAFHDKEFPDFVFCEDVSCFLSRDGAREFVAEVPGSFTRRFVVDLDTEVGSNFEKELRGVQYEPALRFAL